MYLMLRCLSFLPTLGLTGARAHFSRILVQPVVMPLRD
jgi:hypothetical protein